MTKNGEPLNKGNIYISRTSPPSVYEAYFKQFERDFKCFLKSRFEELTSDGMMALTFIGRETTITSAQGVIGMVLNEMVQEVMMRFDNKWERTELYYYSIQNKNLNGHI